MRLFSVLLGRIFPVVILAGLPILSKADAPDNVVLKYHFLGATQLALSPDVTPAKRVFALKSTAAFQELVLQQLGRNVAQYLSISPTTENMSLLLPLLNEITLAESAGCIGGTTGKPLDFVLAIRLSKSRAQAWQRDLSALKAAGIWVEPAEGWLLVGEGTSLNGVRNEYLQQIQKNGKPVTDLGAKCLEAEIDWPALAHWAPLSKFPLKLGRMNLDITPRSGAFYMDCKVSYSEPIPWRFQPWNMPTPLVREPLTSFVTGQDVEVLFRSSETLNSFNTDPFRSQFYFWSMGEMPLQSYIAWPDDDPRASLKELSSSVTAAFNPTLAALNGSSIAWQADTSQLVWTKLTLASPHLQPGPADAAKFIVGGLFPLTMGRGPAPGALWDQFKDRTDLIYYDWELTGPRIVRLLPVTQMLPVLQLFGIGQDAPIAAGKTPANQAVVDRLRVEEEWLVSLGSSLGNTVTEIAKTGDREITITRNSPFVFTSLELVLLSHLLTDTPAGPVDFNLIQRAKMTGPGIPPQR